MLDKDACCLAAQAIYEDLVLSFFDQGLLRSHLGSRVSQSHQVFFICRFPSELRTLHNHKDLFVISEDDLEPIHTALAGTRFISVVLFQVQAHIQEQIIQLYKNAKNLSFVCLFHECFLHAACLDFVTTIGTTLRRHLARVHNVSKYQEFTFTPTGHTKKVTKNIYFVLLHSTFTKNGFEVISPNLEYTETWLCNSAVLTPTIQERIKAIPGVVRFRAHQRGIPVQTTLGVTDRSCITFCISIAKMQELAVPLEQIYQHLRKAVSQLGKQELQRILPFFWLSGPNCLPSFFAHHSFAFLDFRRLSKLPDDKMQSRIQEILISMDITYHFQKRSILVLYTTGTLLEAFRQAIFHESIILPFGKEEGCFQCSVASNTHFNAWQIELQTIGSTKYEAYQIEDDGTLIDERGEAMPELITHLQRKYDASNVRTAIVHVQGKGQQKVIAFLADSSIQSCIPSIIKDHQGHDRILQYKQPDVFTDPQMSNVHIKELRADHHILSHATGNNQHARISAFFPLPKNELSRRRFNRVRSINVSIGRSDVLCTLLDETVPICLVNQDLTTQETAILVNYLLRQQPILNHHSAFLSCSLDHPEPCQNEAAESLLVLPCFACIVHCRVSCNQFLTVYQPRFEEGRVSKCTGNSLQLAVYEHTNLVLFLTGRFEIFDLFKVAPKGQVTTVWKVPDPSAVMDFSCKETRSLVPKPVILREQSKGKASEDELFARKDSSPVVSPNPKRKLFFGNAQSQFVVSKPVNIETEALVKKTEETAPKIISTSDLAHSVAGPIHSSTFHHEQSVIAGLVKTVPIPRLLRSPNRQHSPAHVVDQQLVSSTWPQEKPQTETKEDDRKDIPTVNAEENLTSPILQHSVDFGQQAEWQSVLQPAESTDSTDSTSKPAVTALDSESMSDVCCTSGNIPEPSLLNHLNGSEKEVCHDASFQIDPPDPLYAQSGLQEFSEKPTPTKGCYTYPYHGSTELELSQTSVPTLIDESSTQSAQTPPRRTSPVHVIDSRLDKAIIEEVPMLDVSSSAVVASVDCGGHNRGDLSESLGHVDLHNVNLYAVPSKQSVQVGCQEPCQNKDVTDLLDDSFGPSPDNLSSSFTERRILAHTHALKQLVASKVSLIDMEFCKDELVQAAKLYDNLNATACFYTTALRLVSKADWRERVDFEDHIVHQAMIAVAQGWTTAVGVKTLPFDKRYLALAMATIPSASHGEVKRTYDSIVTTLPSPFKGKASSQVTFVCKHCNKNASREVSTFIVLEPIKSVVTAHEFFNAAIPWTESLLPGAPQAQLDPLPNCPECAIDNTWTIEYEAKCRLVWFQFPRDFHPLALQYADLLGKDPFFAKGRSWKCISAVIHQGRDPLYGENQPADHFYVLENEGPKHSFLCYNNAIGLHHIDETKIRPGDRICALQFRTTDIISKWPMHCTVAIRKVQSMTNKFDKCKKAKNGKKTKVLLSSRKRVSAEKLPLFQNQSQFSEEKHDTYTTEFNALSVEEMPILSPEIIDGFETALLQTKTASTQMQQVTLTKQTENDDPRRCFPCASGASQKLGSSPTRPGPYSIDASSHSAGNAKTAHNTVKANGDVENTMPPYAILSMFDGCGSSVDIIEPKFGYRPKACILCEKDETLRFLVGEKLGITVDQKWQFSSKGGCAFYYANDVDNLFIDNARLLREFAALCSDCHFFVIGGSPCTDLTYAGGDQGLLGICGPASVYFFAVHLALHLLSTVIPRERIRFLVENAGSMRTEHFQFIRGCLGLQHLQKADMMWCTSRLSPAKRLRIFFQNNTSHEQHEAQVHYAADLSWPAEWSPLLLQERGTLREVHLQPFMRPIKTISDLALRYSWSSYHPAALLWRISHWGSRDRFAFIANLSDEKGIPSFQWSALIPPIYVPAWMHLLKVFTTHSSNKDKDLALQDVLPLFHNQSIELPFRFLTDQEVLQVSGLSQNFAMIKKFGHLLTSQTIRAFVGNSFHPKLISIAIGTPEDLRNWVRGRQPCEANIAHPDTVRKYYLQFRQGIIDTLERMKYSPKSSLEPEPYRHIDYRAIVMSPLEKPSVSQPTVGDMPPPYLTKEAVQKNLQCQATVRLRTIGTTHVHAFLKQADLDKYLDLIAVPQWLPITSALVDILGQKCASPLLPAYKQGLLTQTVFARVLLFLRSIVGSCPEGTTGFFVVNYKLNPVHIQYVGPPAATHIYFIRHQETLDIMIFKYGGQLHSIRMGVVSCQDYTIRYSVCTPFFSQVVNNVLGIAIQQASLTWFAEAPCIHTFCESGCALWRLAHSALAHNQSLDRHSFVNCCHTALSQLPLILVEGKVEERRLHCLASTAQALCPNEQSSIWAADAPYTYCILILCQTTPTRVGSDFDYIATLGPAHHSSEVTLPDERSAQAFGQSIFHDAAIDECPSLSVERGVYACIYGEPASIVFRRAQAQLSRI